MNVQRGAEQKMCFEPINGQERKRAWEKNINLIEYLWRMGKENWNRRMKLMEEDTRTKLSLKKSQTDLQVLYHSEIIGFGIMIHLTQRRE